MERIYGSQGSIKINYKTVSDSAVGNADYAQIENGAIQLDPQETQTSIFVTVILFPTNENLHNVKTVLSTSFYLILYLYLNLRTFIFYWFSLKFLQIYPDEEPEEDESFFVDFTSVVRLPSGTFDGK